MDHRGRPESIIRLKLSDLPFHRSRDCDNNMGLFLERFIQISRISKLSIGDFQKVDPFG
jgi:hypothetical protein